MAKINGVLQKTPIAEKSYWFVKPDCGTFVSVNLYRKLSSNSNMVFISADINTVAITDCDGTVYPIGKVIVAVLSNGVVDKNETCEIIYTDSNGDTDSFEFDVLIKSR
jgi:hypothetical protein